MSNTLRLLGLDALSSVGDWIWGSVATREPALVLDSGGRAAEYLWQRACLLSGFETGDAARYDRMPEADVVAPQPETRASLRLVSDCAAGKSEWFSNLADSEALFCHAPRPAGELRLLPAWPHLQTPPTLPRPGRSPARTVAAEFTLRPSPAPISLRQPKLALSYAAAAAPVDPDWTRLRHPEFAHIRGILAWERSERGTSLTPRMVIAAALGTASALAAIVAAKFLF